MAEPRERIFPAAPVQLGRGVISSPFQFAFTGEDRLELTVICLSGSVTIALGTRWITDEQQIFADERTHRTPAVATWETVYFDVSRGFVLNALLYLKAGTPQRGQCWVRLRVVRGASDNPPPLGTLLQGYLTLRSDLAFPGSLMEHPQEGAGALATYGDMGEPGFGQKWELEVPAHRRWRLYSVLADLATDATAANRQPWLQIETPSGVEVFRSATPITQTASQSMRHAWSIGMPLDTLVASSLSLGGILTELRLPPGSIVRTTGTGIQAGDVWTEGRALVEEWVHGD